MTHFNDFETIRQFVLWYSNCHPCKRNADQRIAHDAELRAIITKYGHEHHGGTIDVETAEAMFIADHQKDVGEESAAKLGGDDDDDAIELKPVTERRRSTISGLLRGSTDGYDAYYESDDRRAAAEERQAARLMKNFANDDTAASGFRKMFHSFKSRLYPPANSITGKTLYLTPSQFNPLQCEILLLLCFS